ncbi:MAG: glycine cleavage system protein H [Phycisphaerae bacterium]|nr:glycine cleavage system protein H [Tepidisphaeraceae bacterium]
MPDTPAPQPAPVYYKRSRFSCKLPADRLYTPSHFWALEAEPGVWRVGFTKFATRMLGDLVEHGFEVKPGDAVAVGQAIGFVEGFKALTDLYCVVDGTFEGGNPALDADSTLTESDPHGKGWLYAVRGTPDPAATDVHGYAAMLDLTIDKMQDKGGGDDATDTDDETPDQASTEKCE